MKVSRARFWSITAALTIALLWILIPSIKRDENAHPDRPASQPLAKTTPTKPEAWSEGSSRRFPFLAPGVRWEAEPVSHASTVNGARVLGRWKTQTRDDGTMLRTEITRHKDSPLTIQTMEHLHAASGTVRSRVQIRAGRVLVKLEAGRSPDELPRIASSAGARVGRKLGHQGWYELIGPELDPGSVDRILATLAGAGRSLAHAEPDYIYQVLATPNDPKYLDGSLWGLHNTGQNSGTADADVDAPEAWDVRREAPHVVVAVIDTGINTDHEDLRDNLWVNMGEVAGDGIDNDANGYIDDIHGINSITGSGDPRDDHGHGSHCSGTVGGRGDNNKGIAGVAWNVKLMGLKFLSSAGSGSGSDAIECIDYAVSKGAQILSNSWGGGSFSAAVRDSIIAARNQGVIFVAAAANNSSNNDIAPLYPAGYDVDNVVSVAATTRTDELASYSNYGQGLVHIGAPGSQVLSASHSDNSGYVTMSGTSMATPHVSGMLALLKAQYPSDPYGALVNRLLHSADPKPSLAGKVSTGGRANLNTALTSAPSTPFNDTFAKSAVLSGSSVNVRATNLLATAESGESAHAGIASATSTIWYTWTAPSSGTFILNTQNSLIDTVAAVYTGSSVGALTAIASNDDHTTNTWSRVEFPANIGTTYRIAIAGKNAAQGLIRFTLSGPPGEDNLVNAANLPEFPATATSSNVNATKEIGEASHAGNAGGASIWARWTAPFTGPVVAHTVGSQIDTLFAVYSGPASSPTHGALALVAQNDDYTAAGLTTSLIRFNVTSGTTYYFVTDGKSGAQGPVAFAAFGELANDRFANRATLSGAPLSVDAPNTSLATREDGEPNHGGYGGFRSLWYTWTAPSTGTYQIDTAGSNAVVSLSVYTGSALGSLTPVGSAYLNAGFGNSRVILNATAGSTYVIALDNPDAQFGPAKLNIKAIALAPNDNFASAGTISGTPTLGNPVVVNGYNTGASQESGEPDSTPETILTSVWWNWTAPATARYTLTTEGSDFDTVLGVYTGSTVNSLTKLAEDDDGGPTYTSRLYFDATAGTTYRIRVYGYGGDTGNITLNLEAWQPVANDSFATPHVFTGTTYRHLTYTDEATAQSGEPAHAGIAAMKSVWFSYTATSNGPLTVATDGSSFGTRVAVYTGSTLNALTPVTSNDSYHSATTFGQVTWSGTSGTTYRIAIDGDSGSSGALRTTFVVGPSNDQFANRTVIGPVSSFSETTYNHGATKDSGELGFINSTWTGKTLWWSWTAPSTGQYEITTEGSTRHYANSPTPASLDTLVGVYTGTTFPLSPVAANADIDSARGVLTSRVIVNATAGTTYQITVAGATLGSTEDWLKQAAQGEIKLILRPFQKAANDNIAQATAIGSSLPAFFETSNIGLGIQTGEPGTANSSSDPNYDVDRSKGTAWWRWTAPTSGRYHAATGGLYDVENSDNTILSVYTGPAAATTFTGLSLLTWDKDSAGAGYSTVSFDAVEGQTYYFQVGAESRGKLHFMLAPTAPNDAFSTATLLHGSSVTVSGHNLGATFESGEPMIDSSFYPKYTNNPPRARSVWWRWTAPASGNVVIDTLGSNIFSVMAVYTGSSIGTLNEVVKSSDATRDPYNGEQPRRGCARVSFSASAGTTYFVQIEGGFSDWPSTGIIQLAITQTTSPTGNPFVSIAALPATAIEGGTPGAFVVSRTTADANPLTVNLAISGTAANGSDYETLPTTVVIPAGSYFTTLAVNAIDDDLLESAGVETVVLSVQTGSGYQVGSNAADTVSITDPTSFTATPPVLSLAATGANSLGIEWTFPPADHAKWRLQTGIPAPATQRVHDPFPYNSSVALVGSGSWTEGTGNGTACTIVEGNLSRTGFAESSGRMVSLGNRGARLPYTGGVTDIFGSFLLRLDDLTNLGTSWSSLTRMENGGTNGPGIFVRRAAVGAYDLGIHKRGNGGAVETAGSIQNLTAGTTYLVVFRYRTVVGSTTDDAMEIWLNPDAATFGATTPPTVSLTSIAGNDTGTVWNSFALLPPAGAAGVFDELRLGSNWAAVTHLPWNTGDLIDKAETGVTLAGLTANTMHTFRLRAENAAGTVVSAWSGTLQATTATTANATDWLVQNFATAFPQDDAAWTTDADGDGTANIAEYALGSTPNSTASRPVFTPGTSANHFTLTFTPQRVAGLRYHVEASSNLSTWTSTEVTGLLTPGQPHTHTDTADMATTPKRFLRLRVEFAP